MHESHSAPPNEIPALLDLIPLDELQQLQDALADIHHVASVITDLDGNFLTLPSNEISVCRLIRASSRGLKHCMETSLAIARQKAHGQLPICPTCERMGILKAAVPIFVDQTHLANWWVSQYCGQPPAEDQMQAYAEGVGLDVEALADEFRRLPKGEAKGFYKTIEWIETLAQQFTRLVYEKHLLSLDISRLDRMESELDKHRTLMETQIEERTAELIKANNRLQLEVLERDMAEEQTERKSKLLDAINQIFKQTLLDHDDRNLAAAFLTSARKLTDSPFGFIAEQRQGRWNIMAIHCSRAVDEVAEDVTQPDLSEISKLWRQLMTRGKPVAIPGIDEDFDLLPLPKSNPALNSFLAVPLCKDQRVSGFIAVADKEDGYALVDQTDVEALAQAFIESLLRKRMEADKAKSERRLNLALESANEGLWDFAPRTGHIYYSPRWFGMLGYMPGEFPDTFETWSTLTHPDDLPLLEKIFYALGDGGQEAFDIEIRMLSRSGQWRWLQVRGRTVESDDDGKAKRIVGTLIDISKYKQVEVALQKANDELQRLAALDDLTQIANRRRFDDRLAQEWRRGQREGSSLAVVICDIDYFKDYNDSYGHLKGDETLYAVAQAISAALKRPMDLVARFGGEEFAMILPNTNIVGAGRVAQEVKDAVAALGIKHNSSDVDKNITLSFGVAALAPTPELPSKILVETADKALYRAKSKGRNQIVCISSEKQNDD